MTMEIKTIVRQSVVAALYVALTLAVTRWPRTDSVPNFGNSRFSAFRQDYVVGLTLGCFIANFSAHGSDRRALRNARDLHLRFLISRSRNIFSLRSIQSSPTVSSSACNSALFSVIPIVFDLQVALGEFVTVSVAGVLPF